MPEIPANQYPQLIPTKDHSLFLSMVTLLENGVKYIKAARELDCARVGKIDIEVLTNDPQPGAVRIRVADTGIGVEESEVARLESEFEHPAKFLGKGPEGGLIYAAFLAKENKWQLQLVRRANPTTFQLVIPTQEAGVQK